MILVWSNADLATHFAYIHVRLIAVNQCFALPLFVFNQPQRFCLQVSDGKGLNESQESCIWVLQAGRSTCFVARINTGCLGNASLASE